MNITFLSPPFNLSGGHRVKAIYAERLRQRGHQVTVVAPPHPRFSARDLIRSAVRGRRPGRRDAGTHFDQARFDVRVLDRYRPVSARDVPDADVVVATWWETAEWLADFPASKGSKVYFLQHHEVFEYLPVERVEATWRLPMRKIVVAQWLANLARDRYGDPDAVVVPNAVDCRQFSAPVRAKHAPPAVGLMYSTALFKGCDLALAAFHLAAREVPALRLRSFGEPADSRLPLPSGAEHMPYPAQDRIRDVYAGCDAWLFASRSEGFGLPILEAMACRTPVIGAPAGAAPELLAGGGGILVGPDAPPDMAEAIVRVCRMPKAEWRAMSDAAHRTATRYTWSAATDLFEQALLRAAGQHAPGVGPTI